MIPRAHLNYPRTPKPLYSLIASGWLVGIVFVVALHVIFYSVLFARSRPTDSGALPLFSKKQCIEFKKLTGLECPKG